MTTEGAEEVIRLVMGISVYPWPADGTKHRAWMLTLVSPHTADIDDDVAVATTLRICAEWGPDKITPAQILGTCRSNPAIRKGRDIVPSGNAYRLQTESERLLLEAPETPKERRRRLNADDRAALARLAEAFTKAHDLKGFDHLVSTLGTCGLDWGQEFAEEEAVEVDEVPF